MNSPTPPPPTPNPIPNPTPNPTTDQAPNQSPPPPADRLLDKSGQSPPGDAERLFLEGPRSRLLEFSRLVRISAELLRGLRKLHFVGPCVTVFGSARFPEHHPYYVMAREVSRQLSLRGFTIMTGGGPGIMEAANRGARDAGGPSIGCNIQLPMEQEPNPYLDRFIEFRYFFVRKMMLVKYSVAFVTMPGGFGTLDEIFETLVLMQTGKIQSFPIVVMGRSYWEPMIEFFLERMTREKTIDEADLKLLHLTDDPEDAADHIATRITHGFGQEWAKQRLRPSRLLGER